MRRLVHKPVALSWRQRRSSSLRGSGCRNLALPGVYEQASTPFPANYPTSLLLNLTHATSAAYQMIRLQMKGTLGQYKRARGGYACPKLAVLHCTSRKEAETGAELMAPD